MPNLYHDKIISLKRSYNNMPWFQKLIFPYQLAVELERYSEQDESNAAQLAVFKAFEKSTWFFRKWFFTSFQQFSNDVITKSLRILSFAGLLTGAAAQANFNAVVAHQSPLYVVDALHALHAAGLLTGAAAQANFNAVVAHQHPLAVAYALGALHATGLLTGDAAQANRDAVVAYQSPLYVAGALHALHTAGLLTGDAAQANRDAVVAHRHPAGVADAIRALHPAGLLTGAAAQVNFNAVVAHQDPDRVADAIRTLHPAGLLTGDAAQVNFNAVVAHECPWGVAYALSQLHTAGLLTGDAAQVNFNAVLAHRHPRAVAYALRDLHAAGLLTGDAAQVNFDAVVITHTAILLHPNNHFNGANLWNMMPHGQPTAAQFQAMIEIAQNHAENPDAGSQALMHYVLHQMLGINPQQNRQQPALNTTQSTHTASVHASASQTATNLLNRYGSRIQGAALNTILQAFASWVNAHRPRDLKQQAAARCIRRLTASDYFHTDSVSGVSTQQLMALAWIAIHDENARTATLDDAKQQLIEALYEIQRGYNLSETGVDDNEPEDIPICTGGTFNKWCEKLRGVHPDAVMLFITQAGAAAKLPIVVREEAQNYLDTLTPGSLDDVTLQEQINQNNLQPLWGMISLTVANRLFGEFGSLYRQGVNSVQFIAFVSEGLYALEPDRLNLPAARLAGTTNSHTLFQLHENSVDTQQHEGVPNATI